MSYVPTGAVFDRDAKEALRVSADEIQEFGPSERMEYIMRYHELKATKQEAFWNAVSAFATAALPILAFLGVERLRR